jgi:hypothetical protein
MRNIGWAIGSITEVERRKMWRYEEIWLCELPRISKLEKSYSVITTEIFYVLDVIFYSSLFRLISIQTLGVWSVGLRRVSKSGAGHAISICMAIAMIFS